MEDAIQVQTGQTAANEHGGSVDVQVTTTVTQPPLPDSTVKKIIVAVHGIGDQYTFATIHQ